MTQAEIADYTSSYLNANLSIQITARRLDIIGSNFSSIVVSQYWKLYGTLRE